MKSDSDAPPTRLSFCIPTLNRARFIGETLDSIICQAPEELEIVVVDGGSTDNTAEIVEQAHRRFPRLRYVTSRATNGEAPGPSNAGFDRDCDRSVELATGEFCWLLPDDDVLTPGAIRTVLDRLGADVSLVVINAEVRDASLSQIMEPSSLNMKADREYLPNEADRLLMDTGRFLSYVGAVVVRRSVWLSRERRRFYGCGFIHFCVLFQERLPCRAVVIARPLILIRYGNTHWFEKRWFRIRMFDWPRVVWSLYAFSDEAKRRVIPKEPWRSPLRLLSARAKGTYSLAHYRDQIAPLRPPLITRMMAQLIAVAPGRLLNSVALFCLSFTPRFGVHRADYRDSRFYIGRWFG